MQRTRLRFSQLLIFGALACCAAACSESPRSAAAEVSGEDLRRLPPDRKETLPDVMMQHADHGRTLGADSVKLSVLVISDYQCTACRTWFERVLPVIRSEYIDRGLARLAWVHYPLRGHPSAVRAASAALCASAQDKFWEASARLFAAQDRWSAAADANAMIDSIANVPGVDVLALQRCAQSGRMLKQLRADIDWVDAAKAGTPPLIVIGTHRVTGDAPLASLRAVIDSAIAGK